MPDISPQYLTQGPGGEVAGLFPGGLSVYSRDLTRSYTPEEISARKVAWVKESNGAVVAHIEGRHDPTINQLRTIVSSPGVGQTAEVSMETNTIGLGIAEASITALAGLQGRKILDSNNQSDFAYSGIPNWVTMTNGANMGNSWTVHGVDIPAYTKDGLHYFQGRGFVTSWAGGNTAVNTFVMTFPAGFRPLQTVACTLVNLSVAGGFANVYIDTAGIVRVSNAIGPGQTFDLNQLRWPTQ